MQIHHPEVAILVVDDREENLFSFGAILEDSNYTVLTANDGQKALKLLLQHPNISLILMDVQMPVLNGFETARLIYGYEHLRHIPIIFITANDRSDENLFLGYQFGGVDYIYKPVHSQLLKAKVAIFVELYYRKHEMQQQEQKLIEANRRLEAEIAERKASEETIRKLNSQLLENIDRLKDSNDDLERFAYVASHDLQEPLRKISIFSDMLQKSYGSKMEAKDADRLQRIIRASDRMKQLIKNLLQFSRSANDAGAFEKTDLNLMLRSILSDLEATILAKGATVEVLPLPTLNVNPVLMRQVFQNLLANALKFTANDTRPEVRISAQTGVRAVVNDVETDSHIITVEDNGIGFDMAFSEQIFVPFKRLETSERYEGAGIGLAICKRIVERHNGTITVSSVPGKGSTFRIILPVQD